MNKIVLTLFILIDAVFAFSQTENLHCGADEMRISTLKQNPKVAKAVITKEQQLEAFTQNFVQNYNDNQNKKSTSSATYIIPVVFHVIHNYGTENISDAQLKDGIDIVNKTFRKLRPDTASIVSVFKGIHADCDIEFRLATKDPNGNCHSGINRIASPLTTSGDHRIKKLIHWPPTQYLNVYVVMNAAGLAGHAVWPSDADTIPLWDGIVLSHNYVGTIGTSNLTQSVAFAHECGHYLNLHHIWGGNNVPNFYYYPCADPGKDCNIDDLVADTPPTIGWQSCNLNGASCGNTVDNVQNAMDYSYCNIMFTQGQKARMHACLTATVAGRNNLWQPANLIATGVYTTTPPVCKAEFTSNKTVICPSNQVAFTNTSYHGPFTAISWKFAGGTPSVSAIANPTITYSAAGTYSVELKVKNGLDSVSIIKQNYISVQTSTTSIAYPFSEGFESIVSLNGPEWLTNNLDTSNTWQLTNLASSSGNKSIMIDNYTTWVNGKDELYSKPINLTGAGTLNISFKYAFARRDTSNKDQLQMYVIQTCNGTTISRFLASGATLETVPPRVTAFYPSSQSEWKLASAMIPSFVFTNGFRLKFVFSGNRGNNIFIDDINIDINAGLNNLIENISELTIFPNPTLGNCRLKFTVNEHKTLSAKVYNMLGEQVMEIEKHIYSEGENHMYLQTENLANGSYIIQLTDGVSSLHKQLIITK
jgi:PKD repeat protein